MKNLILTAALALSAVQAMAADNTMMMARDSMAKPVSDSMMMDKMTDDAMKMEHSGAMMKTDAKPAHSMPKDKAMKKPHTDSMMMDQH